MWEPAACSLETLRLVHPEQHIQRIERLAQQGGGWIDADTHVSAGSWDAALRAVGACVEAVQRVAEGSLDNAYCLVRPPGHHATPVRAMGFCLFSNVAIAAEWLLKAGHARRVAILDYDVHHGNGTQDVFFDRDDVLYISTHQYPFYPGSGHWSETGSGAGAGYTVNVPLPHGAGDAAFQAARSRLVEPLVRRFCPDFLLVSLGFDAFYADPLASLRLSIGSGFMPLIASAKALADELCGGKLVVALEGGYHLDALAYGSEAVCQVLLGGTPEDPLGPPPSEIEPVAVEGVIQALAQQHQLSPSTS